MGAPDYVVDNEVLVGVFVHTISGMVVLLLLVPFIIEIMTPVLTSQGVFSFIPVCCICRMVVLCFCCFLVYLSFILFSFVCFVTFLFLTSVV